MVITSRVAQYGGTVWYGQSNGTAMWYGMAGCGVWPCGVCVVRGELCARAVRGCTQRVHAWGAGLWGMGQSNAAPTTFHDLVCIL